MRITIAREKNSLFPHLQQLLLELGENIRLARLRRKWSQVLVAERAGIARNTLRAIERGDPSVTFGSYVNVLHCLGLENDLKLIGRDDVLGRKLLKMQAYPPRQERHVLVVFF